MIYLPIYVFYVYICVYHVVAAPQVVTHPTNISAAAPFNALFKCSVQGYGYLTVTWYKNNKKLVSKKVNHTVISLLNITASVLTIPNVTIEDVGAYYCVVWAKLKAARSLAANLILAGIMHLLFYV